VKTLSAIFTTVALAAAMPAHAQKFDLNTISCKQFIAMEQAQMGIIGIWLGGYYMEEDAPPVVDVDKIKADVDKLVAYCKQNPEATLSTAAEESIAN
jgi:acid stress chaperone HdeB